MQPREAVSVASRDKCRARHNRRSHDEGRKEKMKLINFMILLNDNTNLIVWKGEDVYTYDGRDAIPEELNNDEIGEISHSTEAIVVFLK